jgi:tetratricopeptide (TPR) repeat protein
MLLKKIKGIIKRSIVALIGVLGFLLIFEFFLRIIGIINSQATNSRILNNSRNDSHIILCLGDSWTYGIGAAYGKDYPSQLQAMLDSASIKQKFKVINRGRGAHNTTQILEELTNTLEKNIKPELVIFLGGEANEWNYWGYNAYIKGNSPSSAINDYLYRIRVYKLARLLFKNVNEKIRGELSAGILHNSSFANTDINHSLQINGDNLKKEDKQNIGRDGISYRDPYRVGVFCRSNRQYDEAIGSFKKCLGINPNAVECYAGIGGVYTDQQQYTEAIKWLRKGIAVNPNAAECYAGIGWVYKEQGRYAEAIKWFKKGIAVNPKSAGCYEGIGFVYKVQYRYDEAIAWFKKGIALDPGYGHIVAACCSILKDEDKKEFLKELSKDRRLPQGFINMLEVSNKINLNSEINRWKTHDIEEIIRICRENKIKIMLLDYPKPCAMNDILRNIAKNNSALFLDNDEIFRQLWNSGEKRGDYYSADGHCNARGYAMMAKNIFDRIKKDKLLGLD